MSLDWQKGRDRRLWAKRLSKFITKVTAAYVHSATRWEFRPISLVHDEKRSLGARQVRVEAGRTCLQHSL